ncbi:MAG: acetyl-CoA carboxylase biotin carboxyl carrier protein subunit [Bacteroidetes bacterium]|jgi:biotin carboxyl carrier protein|nr:acetyl-CoA carboxylase biotin carboxyl carrier protein subunit [Bacteroidota bacterium]
MYTIKVNGNKEFKTELIAKNNDITGTLNGKEFKADIIKVRDGVYHLLKDNVSYNLEVVKHMPEEKKLFVKINNTPYTLDIKDKYDDLLHSLGLDALASKKVNDIKAPMPGMVLNVLVTEGQEVKKGDGLIVLEAMKMENILKSPTDGVIKKIAITKGVAVEKNQLLIQF